MFDLQKRIATQTNNCMRINHNDYRNFYTEKRVEQWKGFIDGDLVESVSDMGVDTIKSIINGLLMPKTDTKSIRMFCFRKENFLILFFFILLSFYGF